MTRKPIIAGNWKLNKTIKEAIELVTLLKRMIPENPNIQVVICPPYTALGEVAEILMESEIALGAQNLYWEENGAFTGEISGSMIKEAGANFVIIGHSERRQFFSETNETVNKRIKAALNNKLTPIVCVGEMLKEREADKTFAVIENQIRGAFSDLAKSQMEQIVVAYEPVWAIGTGKVATPAQAEEVHAFIRKEIFKIFGEEISGALRILYGGSVKPDNIASLMEEPDIDGALVGGASLEAKSFSDIVKNVALVHSRRT